MMSACAVCQHPVRGTYTFCNGCGMDLRGGISTPEVFRDSSYRQMIVANSRSLAIAKNGHSRQSLMGIAIDARQNLYITDSYNHCIRQVSPKGTVKIFVGGQKGKRDGRHGKARLNHPVGLAIDATGHLYVSDLMNRRLCRISPRGPLTTLNCPGQPYGGLAATSDGTLYFFNRLELFKKAGDFLCRLAPDGTLSILVKVNQRCRWLSYQVGADSLPHHIWSPYREKRIQPVSFPQPALSSGWHSPLAIDLQENVYIAEKHRLLKITPEGRVLLLAGNGPGFANGSGEQARFNTPGGLVVDSLGNLYVSDTLNHAIRCVSPDAFVSTVMTQERLKAPQGIAISFEGSLLFVDSDHWHICRIAQAQGAMIKKHEMKMNTPKGGPSIMGGLLARFLSETKESVAIESEYEDLNQTFQAGNRTQKLAILQRLFDGIKFSPQASILPWKSLLLNILKDPDVSVRGMFLKEFCTLIHEQNEALMAVTLLAQHQDPNRILRKNIIQILDYLGRTYALYGHVIPILVDFMHDAEVDVETYASEQLMRIREEGYESLVDPLLEEIAR